MGHKRKAVEKVVKPVTADTQVASTALTEDEQVAMAIAMSLQTKGVESHHSSQGDSKDGVKGLLDDLEDLDEEEVYAQIRQMEEQQKQQEVLRQQQEEQQRNKRDPAQVQKEAEQRLPEEPPPSASSTCRVAIRLPDGSRLQRCFDRNSHTVQALHDWCVSRLPEAAGGRPYQLVPAAPGAQQALEDRTQTLEVAGVANAMLAVKWLD
ncbi:hypothetical protein CEUSTIGMA_g11869.t1 [Chlamydomonas eustigma]|uniref:UBX domain-containing protein n=1 Tax=Chlamydomonas eustigma TaxID=1157962 RepID=A0A250XNC1_9CHLO|nr:hypothetical protein CEUSTIGMA_g11869.t1 [Chlamydomonas eustigma]|eukprot:GAX84449.1 hypothetical protein CEUSTIGMA_g11869.t1 [Chlamydomonas eustigma]